MTSLHPFRAGLSVAGDGAIDDAGIDGPDRLVSKAQALHHAGPELFDQYVRVAKQRLQHLERPRILEVQADRFLAPVQHQEAEAVLADEGRDDADLVADAGTFDLDHLGSRLGQDEARQGAGEMETEIEDFDVFKWVHGNSLLAMAGMGGPFLCPARAPAGRPSARG